MFSPDVIAKTVIGLLIGSLLIVMCWPVIKDNFFKDIGTGLLTGCWFIFLTFPMLALKVDPIEMTIAWRWHAMFRVGLAAFCLYLLITWTKEVKATGQGLLPYRLAVTAGSSTKNFFVAPKVSRSLLIAVALLALCFPFIQLTPSPPFLIINIFPYQTNVMTTALIYVVLGLGLNIVVGVAGLLDLGYVAFYAVGAYSYALLNLHFGLGFWTVLPIGAVLAALFGIVLGFPVLRLRGDYLAIVTLGFGEIIRLILQNWNAFSKGPSGISGIPRPGFFGMDLSINGSIIYLYYLMIGLVLFTIFVVNRLQNSRIGRAWYALREDEIACQSMGIDKTKTKLTAFALGATWAGMAGVIFAAKSTFVSPDSFTFWESAIILCIVVLGGRGSITGVILAALLLTLLPEYFRVFSAYRMLVFGAALVAMMVFRPQGLVSTVRRTYTIPSATEPLPNEK